MKTLLTTALLFVISFGSVFAQTAKVNQLLQSRAILSNGVVFWFKRKNVN